MMTRALLVLALSMGAAAPVFTHELIHAAAAGHAHEHDGVLYHHEHESDHHGVAVMESDGSVPPAGPQLLPAAAWPLRLAVAAPEPAGPPRRQAPRAAGLDPPPRPLRLLLASASSSLAPPAA